jgi:flagellar basal-body rod protein FlgB
LHKEGAGRESTAGPAPGTGQKLPPEDRNKEEICMKSLIEPHVNLVGKVMNMQLQRQNVVMSNVANVKTPGYKPRVLEFEDDLQAALNLDSRGKISRTHEKHLPGGFDLDDFNATWDKELKPRIVHGEDRVNLDKEMAAMAKTSMQYNALTTVMKSSFDGIKQIIAEGGKV